MCDLRHAFWNCLYSKIPNVYGHSYQQPSFVYMQPQFERHNDTEDWVLQLISLQCFIHRNLYFARFAVH